MSGTKSQLSIPPAAEADEHAVEMARVWVADRELHCSLNVGPWHRDSKLDEHECWGVLMADLARQISDALEEVTDLSGRESLGKLVNTFNSEILKAATQASSQSMENPGGE